MTELQGINSLTKKYKFIRKNIEFSADGTILRGWLYTPIDYVGKFPVIIMAHGFAALKEMYLDNFANVFASHGFAVVVFDYNGFGDSDGYPRQEVNPWKQIEDYRSAITFAATIENIDRTNIGIWGTSYSGGHVLMVAAMDHRVKCVVSQVPTINGSESALRRTAPDKVHELYQAFTEDRIGRMQGENPKVRKIVSENITDTPAYDYIEAKDWYLESGELSKNWVNRVTLRSIEYSRIYNPGDLISLISPRPLLLLVGMDDYVTPTDLTLRAYEKALEPKELVFIPGGHFDPYINQFTKASTEALKWFEKHLKNESSIINDGEVGADE